MAGLGHGEFGGVLEAADAQLAALRWGQAGERKGEMAAARGEVGGGKVGAVMASQRVAD